MASIASLAAKDTHNKLIANQMMSKRVGELMPAGRPAFADIRYYPSIVQLIDISDHATVHKCLYLLVQDFCMSVGVVRNMNLEQMAACADMLLQKCGNFRMEDYVMMFTLAKWGELGVKIMDRIDITVIAEIHDAYWLMRDEAGKRIQEGEFQEYERRIRYPMANPDQKLLETSEVEFDAEPHLRKLREQMEADVAEEKRIADERFKENRLRQIRAFALQHGMDEHGNPLPDEEPGSTPAS